MLSVNDDVTKAYWLKEQFREMYTCASCIRFGAKKYRLLACALLRKAYMMDIKKVVFGEPLKEPYGKSYIYETTNYI